MARSTRLSRGASWWQAGLRVGVASALLLALHAWTPRVPGALAYTSCSGSHINFDGPYGGQGVWGANAYQSTRQASYCSGSSGSYNLIAVFTMVQGNPLKIDAYAQSGYAEVNGSYSTMQWYVEYKEDNTHNHVRELGPQQTGLSGSPSTGSTHQYTVSYENNYGDMGMWIDPNEVLFTPFNPWGNWPGPWVPQWTGETDDAGDNSPGTTSAHASFTSMGIQTTIGNSFVAPSGLSVFANNPQCYSGGFVGSGETAFDIWDSGASGC